MSDIAIRVVNLSKQYRIGSRPAAYRTLRETLTDAVAAPFRRAGRLLRGQAYGAAGLEETIWALKDVSFEVRHGEVVGIIGRNGAGKSTLLKVLSRITEPTEGYADVYGRVGSLLEVGTGFHPELTGRENIYLNGAILGMTRAEIDRKFDEIVDFAEIERFIDTPVKHYSSGMGLRLGFAVAAHLEPEILVVDEVLAVGDAQFQKKCLGKMGEVAGEGRTVLFVSHNMAAIRALCEKVVWVDEGRTKLIGTSEQTIAEYISATDIATPADLTHLAAERKGDELLTFTQWTVVDDHYGEGYQVGCNHACEFRIHYEASGQDELRDVSVSLTIKDVYGTPLLTGATQFRGEDFASLPASGVFVCRFEKLPLLPNTYKVHLWCRVGKQAIIRIPDAGAFRVVPDDVFGSGRLPRGEKHGVMVAQHSWRFEEEGRGEFQPKPASARLV